VGGGGFLGNRIKRLERGRKKGWGTFPKDVKRGGGGSRRKIYGRQLEIKKKTGEIEKKIDKRGGETSLKRQGPLKLLPRNAPGGHYKNKRDPVRKVSEREKGKNCGFGAHSFKRGGKTY